MYKKATGVVLLTMFLLCTFTGYALAAGFSDLQDHWAAGEINRWVDKGLAGGYEDGTFRPNRQVTRAEFVALVNRAFAVDKKGSVMGFSDVKNGTWYYDEVTAASAAGYIGGYSDGTFGPDRTITRQEAASVLVRLLKLAPATGGLDQIKDEGQIAVWARGNVGAVVRDGLMKGMPDNTFMPQKGISRAEAVVSLDRALAFTSGATPPDEPQPIKEPVKETGIKGEVTYNNEAAQNAVIKIYKADGYEVLETAKTDANGSFKIKLEPGNYDLTATTDKEVAYQSDAQVTDDKLTGVNLEMQAAAVVKGTLKDKDENPVKNATLIFTTNPTFTTSTNNNGEYSAVLVPDRDYRVRSILGEEDSVPVEIEDKLSVGHAGQHTVSLSTEIDTEQPTPGGGGAPGGDETENEAPVVESVTFVVDGKKVTESGSNNNFNIDLTDYPDDAMFTELTVQASDADKANVEFAGKSAKMTFNQEGEAYKSFSYPLSLLRIMGNEISVPVTVTGKTGLESEVNVNIEL